MSAEAGFSKGLAGVVADTTAVSQVQGEAGRLIYRGIPIEELAQNATYEECVFFALYGSLPKAQQLEAFTQQMKCDRALPQYVEAIITGAPRTAHPMSILQAAVAAMAYEEGPVNLKQEEANIKTASRIISAVSTIVARVSRHRRGLTPIAPRDDFSHAANFLYMLNGQTPDAKEARMFDIALILHLDHDFNASTFAGRVVAATEAKLATSLSAAVGALSGPLHGGANEKVLEMADSIGSPAKAKEWVMNAIATKAKVMGFGHRVYRTLDPRARILRGMLEDLVAQKGKSDTYETLRIVHDTMIEELGKKEKDYIWPNVDFWSGAMYRLMGLEPIDFTPIFAVARVAGWSAHIIEMWRDNRIYRPAAQYVGPQEAHYKPMAERG